MKDLLTGTNKLAAKMAVVWVFLFTIVSLSNSVITAFYGMKWNSMDIQDRVMIGFLIVANWGTTMMAFLSKAITRTIHGDFPIGSEDDEITRTSHVKQVTTGTTTLETKPHEEGGGNI